MGSTDSYFRSPLFDLSKFEATDDDKPLFPLILSKLWPPVVRDGDVCVQPPETWALLLDGRPPGFKMVKKERTRPHPTF